jgi:hypothetical protein
LQISASHTGHTELLELKPADVAKFGYHTLQHNNAIPADQQVYWCAVAM